MNVRFSIGKGNNKELGRIAKEDAAGDMNHARDYHIMHYGNRRVIDETRSLHDRLMLEKSDRTKLKALTATKEALEDERTKFFAVWLYIAILLFLGLAEAEQFNLYWADQGSTGPGKLVMAISSSVATIFLPYMTVHFGKEWAKELSAAKEQVSK